MHINCAHVSVPWEMAAYLSCLSSSSNSMEQLQLWIKNNLHRNTSPLATIQSSLPWEANTSSARRAIPCTL